MKFKGRNKSLSIRILGYEFENSSISEDLDWLDIEVTACEGDLRWSKKGAFIRTEELLEILQFLKGSMDFSKLEFLESDLSFSIINNIIFIHLNYNLHPKGDKFNMETDSEYKLFFDITDEETTVNIKEVENWIKSYQVRARLLE